MRPPVGEEMSRQPSLPSLTARGNPGADLASPRAKQPNHPTQRPVRTRRLNRARTSTAYPSAIQCNWLLRGCWSVIEISADRGLGEGDDLVLVHGGALGVKLVASALVQGCVHGGEGTFMGFGRVRGDDKPGHQRLTSAVEYGGSLGVVVGE